MACTSMVRAVLGVVHVHVGPLVLSAVCCPVDTDMTCVLPCAQLVCLGMRRVDVHMQVTRALNDNAMIIVCTRETQHTYSD